jgi:fibronectin type 3 domain-containing protein
MLSLLAALAGRASLSRPAVPDGEARAQAAYARLPLSFEANKGQTDAQVKFLSRGSGYTLWLTGTEAVLGLRSAECGVRSKKPGPNASLLKPEGALSPDPRPQTPDPATLRMRLLGSNPQAKVSGAAPLPAHTNYFLGNDPKKWRTDVRSYGKVQYQGVYPGVDLVYYGNQNQLEYDFVVKPGADPEQIRLAYSGAEQVEVDGQGDLVLHTPGGDVRQHKPVVYQEVDGQRVPVAGEYVLRDLTPQPPSLRGKGEQSFPCAEDSPLLPGEPGIRTDGGGGVAREVSFRLAKYDRTRPLVIDPVLSYGTYLGGSAADFGFGVAVDGNGYVYVTGYTSSTDFPTTDSYQGDQTGADAFVVKLDLTQSGAASLLYATYLGGGGGDYGYGIAVDGDGNAYVTGSTSSTDFPTTAGKYQGDPGDSGYDAFVVKLDPTGSGDASLLYATYLGGNGNDFGFAITVGTDGRAYVTGQTSSADFPTTAGKYQGGQVGDHAFMAKLDPTGSGTSTLLYSTYLRGNGTDVGLGIAVDSSGNAYVSGTTNSTDFPTTAGKYQGDPGDSDYDAFVVKLDPTGSGAASLLYATYLGGNGQDLGRGIAVDGDGNVYVTGETLSTDFPTTAGKYQGDQSGFDAFVVKLDPTGSGDASLLYATYLGGSGNDFPWGIAVDSSANAYVSGYTDSTDFPTTLSKYQGDQPGRDAFVVKVDPTKTGAASLLYSTYLGGSNDSEGRGIAVDKDGNAYVTGTTYSTDFPTTAGKYQGDPGDGDGDVFVVKLAPVTPAAPTGLTATVVSETEIDLSWTHDGTNVDHFEVYHKPQGGAYSLAGTTNASTVTFQDTGLTPGTLYYYFVRAVGEVNADSAEVSKATPAAPSTPANLQAAVFPGARVRLTWEENDANAKEFHLERKTDGNPYSQIALLGSSVRQYYDETVAPGTHYTYRARAFGITLYSDYSTEAEATTPAAPAAPTGLTAQPYYSTQIRLTWTPGSGPAPYQYRIERDMGGGKFQEVGQARGSATAFVDGNLTPGTPYTYRVRAAVFGAFSDYSNTADGTTASAAATPTALDAAAVSANQVKLTWTPGSGTVTYFRIERLFNGNWVEVGRAKPAATSFLEGGLAAETTYRYRVRGVNGAAVSAPSPEAEAATLAVPEAPTALTAKALSRGRIQLTWTPGAGTTTGFLIERQDGATWVEAGRTRADRPGFIDTGRAAGTFYNYRVRAMSGTYRSAPSPEAGDTAKS